MQAILQKRTIGKILFPMIALNSSNLLPLLFLSLAPRERAEGKSGGLSEPEGGADHNEKASRKGFNQ